MAALRAVVIGAGIGGLACAIELAANGFAVEVVERAPHAGGKMRETIADGKRIDSGPTVFTMKWVFEELFASAGGDFASAVPLSRLAVLARHAWDAETRFDLFADLAQSQDAVSRFAGAEEGRRFLAFAAEAKTIYQTLKPSFLNASRPGALELSRRIGLHRPGALLGIRPFETLWGALGKHFHDPRLRQLFGRYATYSGSSPFLAPATLMLIAHVEQDGVWSVDGGMQRLAEALQALAVARGVTFRFGAAVTEIVVRQGVACGVVLVSGERLEADAVVVNADAAALPAGLFGGAVTSAAPALKLRERSLSAVTWAGMVEAKGFPLLRHNVFFSGGYQAEFADLFERSRLPEAPTVYLCAQDRPGHDTEAPPGKERIFMLVNAPPTGGRHRFDAKEIAQCQTSALALLARCGMPMALPAEAVLTTPEDFNRMFPATGGALYGMASHGWRASFQRPASNTPIPGLYLAGGSTHPGAGVPMAALSGRLAAARLLADRASTRTSRKGGIFGGISTR
jgi:1-hydroxycarotenoid 3,4-desaturase